MASSAYPSLFSEKITKEIGGASSLIGNREARTKSIFKKYGDKSAYFFGPSLIFRHIFSSLLIFSEKKLGRKLPVKKNRLACALFFFFYSTNSPASARFFSPSSRLKYRRVALAGYFYLYLSVLLFMSTLFVL
jgi:hypothetical protein